MPEMNNETLRSLGFEDEREFYRLVASINLVTTEAVMDFENWQDNDGTKRGLVMLIDEHGSV
jgi:hypothetical protein